MMSAVADVIISFLDLIEAEGRALRRSVANLGWALAFIVMAALLALTSAGFFFWGLHQYVAMQLSPVASAFLLSFIALVLAVIAAGFALWRVR
jgi:hypothetical protein